MLKINCKGKRTVGKANKVMHVEKIIGFKNWNYKKRKEKKRGKLRRPAKAQVETEVYNSNKKCDWKKKHSKLNYIS